MDITAMLRDWYGYGRWDAPYWFLGPEPGTASDEDGLQQRYQAWLKLGGGELGDCRAHHLGFGFTRWHREYPPAATQSTWRQLIRLLLAYKHHDTSTEAVREYQRIRWGMADGETCVIELSAMPAHALTTDCDRLQFREHRINFLRAKIRECQPEFVVMYGAGQMQDWLRIAGQFDADGMATIGPTLVLATAHPQTRGMTNADWAALGTTLQLRIAANRAGKSPSSASLCCPPERR